MNVSWDRYRVFAAVARQESVTRAAKDLNLTQSAVSQALKKLEGEIGSSLVIRSSRGVRLTAEGRRLYAHVDPAGRMLEAGERQIEEMQQLKLGDIYIGASDTLCRYYLLPVLETFHRDHPDIRLHVANGTSEDTLSLLRAGRVDFGVVNLPITADDVVVSQGPSLQDGFVVGPSLRRLAKNPMAAEELVRHPLLLLESGSVTRAYFDAYFLSQGVTVHPEIELGSLDLLVEFARSGLGIAGVILNFLGSALDRHDLYPLIPIPALVPRRMGLITLRTTLLSHAAQALLNQLRDHRGPLVG